MKETIKMSRTINQLEKMFSVINLELFEGLLPTPIITVQSKPGSMGHCTTKNVWKRKDDRTYEINIAAEVLDYPIEETLDTLIHEMVHLYCRIAGIKECSRNGYYHNEKFKEEAEKRLLECIYTGTKYGWNTKASDKLVEYALKKGWTEFKIGRDTEITLDDLLAGINFTESEDNDTSDTKEEEKEPKKGKKGHSIKYQCPQCHDSVRATKKVNILCGNCMKTMIEC